MKWLTALLALVGLHSCQPNGDNRENRIKNEPISTSDRSRHLPPFASDRPLGGNGLRFIAEPSFIEVYYVVEFRSLNAGKGSIRTPVDVDLKVSAPDQALKGWRSISYHFTVPEPDYRIAIERIDYLLARGEVSDSVSDGTGFVVERDYQGHVLSYLDGNFGSAKDPSLAISALILPLLHQYGPKNVLPERADWYPDENPDGSWRLPPEIEALKTVPHQRATTPPPPQPH